MSPRCRGEKVSNWDEFGHWHKCGDNFYRGKQVPVMDVISVGWMDAQQFAVDF